MTRAFCRLIGRRVNWPALFGLGCVVFVMLFGGVLAPYDVDAPDYTARLKPPSAAHLLGTDELGRDLLSRVLAGTRLSLGAALEAELLVVFVGMFVGLLAGHRRGLFSEIIMRLTDVFLAFPGLLLAIAIVAVLGPSLQSAILAVSITWWPVYARLTRSAVLTVREQEYITAARAIGATEWRIMLGYVLPNSVTPVIVQFTLSIGAALETIAGLSFLGFGAQPPTPEWGALIFAGFRYILVAPWYSTFPGVAIVLVVLIFSALGDALQLSLGGV